MRWQGIIQIDDSGERTLHASAGQAGFTLYAEMPDGSLHSVLGDELTVTASELGQVTGMIALSRTTDPLAGTVVHVGSRVLKPASPTSVRRVQSMLPKPSPRGGFSLECHRSGPRNLQQQE